MKLNYRIFTVILLLFGLFGFIKSSFAQSNSQQIQLGNSQTEVYLPLLKNKKVGLVANQSSVVGNQHLLDLLLENQIDVIKVFSPEHGFRGDADAGEKVDNSRDTKTNLPIVSLYGKNKKPRTSQLEGLEVLLFDLQDVGVRFYTYISTLHYVMEAAAEQKIKVIILDRPNPNGFYIDGPILQESNKSFIGMHPIPVVHGLTIGEYAQMINGEGWLTKGIKCELEIVKTLGYTHKSRYEIDIPPSPNLPNAKSINLYPSLCFFEGTPISVGRGTDFPFQQFGHPSLALYSYVFKPKPSKGAKNPKLNGQNCYGKNLTKHKELSSLELGFLIEVYNQYDKKDEFFTSFFDLLAGTDELRIQIQNGLSQDEIRESWSDGLDQFSAIRSKYLLYEDF